MLGKKFVMGFAALAALAVGQGAQAAYTVTTSITSVSDPGGSAPVSLAAGLTFAVDGLTITVGAAGGTSFTTAGGLTVYLVNFTTTSNGITIPNEAIYVTGPNASTDRSVISFSETITITNGGSTGTFVESGLISIFGDSPGVYLVSANSVTPPSQTIGDTLYAASMPQASSGTINNATNNGSVSVVITPAAVPEPASAAMLGLGLLGFGGFDLRRRSAKAVRAASSPAGP